VVLLVFLSGSAPASTLLRVTLVDAQAVVSPVTAFRQNPGSVSPLVTPSDVGGPFLQAAFADGSSTGLVGGTLNVNGAGWAPGQDVKLDFGSMGSATVAADSSGSFTTSVTIPTNASPGDYTIQATQTLTQSTTISVASSASVTTESTTAQNAEPYGVFLAQPLESPNDRGSIFVGQESAIAGTQNCALPTGGSNCGLVGDLFTLTLVSPSFDSMGAAAAWYCSEIVPGSVHSAYGGTSAQFQFDGRQHWIDGAGYWGADTSCSSGGNSSGGSSRGSLAVSVRPEDSSINPTLQATFANGGTTGYPGDVLTVTGTGWAPGQDVTVDWGGLWSTSSTTTAASDGSISFNPTNIPADATPGDYTFTATQTVTETAAITVGSTHLPIILIPGVGGTALNDPARLPNEPGSQPYEVWPCPGFWQNTLGCVGYKTSYASPNEWIPMLLTPDGTSGGTATVGDILRTGVGRDFYSGMINYLQSDAGGKYVLDKDLFLYPYDWRLDLATQFAGLDSVIQTALQTTSAPKVILLCHSMGGVLAYAYVHSTSTYAPNVDTIITMGTPFFGSVLPYNAMVNGYNFGNPALSPIDAKVLVQNMPGAYELLVRNTPFIHYNGNWLTLDQAMSVRYLGVQSPNIQPDTPLDAPTAARMLTDASENGASLSASNKLWSSNPTAYNAAKQFWQNYIGTPGNPLPLPDGVKLYAIIGTGVDTLGYYELKKAVYGNNVFYDGQWMYLYPNTVDGDGTVPKLSAQISTATSTYYVTGVMHGDLPSDANVQSIVGSIISGNPSSSGNNPSGDAGQSSNKDYAIQSLSTTSVGMVSIRQPQGGDQLTVEPGIRREANFRLLRAW
jgi:hypothetical protein